jgi:hypothetical protein
MLLQSTSTYELNIAISLVLYPSAPTVHTDSKIPGHLILEHLPSFPAATTYNIKNSANQLPVIIPAALKESTAGFKSSTVGQPTILDVHLWISATCSQNTPKNVL